ncbi:hypothetical protein IE81DRAFT_327067 [Ceraceosorus guamensis]|uniref:Malonyl-CoA:ACP transacylase (MAT) domain-containing protein n=1 Tax=Ceraceosorus guamensis TaxID=1522189 RepID=A0A316VMS4_9BASI|nr:hypothetical protein IE81DRAFT_327067 [Ceraceosorus guamensis]PWN38866.1 hypothetical protein IE81DRAFT_327067 [Ceraceosorus guamensis]
MPSSKEKQAAWIAANRDYLITRLNADSHRPYFPQHADGSVAKELGEMTYEEVARRLLQLTYLSGRGWIDSSWRLLMGDWLRRTEERFVKVDPGTSAPKTSAIQSYIELDEGTPALDRFFDAYPRAKRAILAAEDVSLFIEMCRRRGTKPVPFIPILDSDLKTWFKKDSLWQSEDLDAVVDRDPQRVFILQGPVAARHSTKANVPIKEMLGDVEQGLITRMLQRYYDGDESKVPSVDYLGPQPPALNTAALLKQHDIKATQGADGRSMTYQLGSNLPPSDDWLELLAGRSAGWFRALLRSVSIVQGKSYADNPISRILAPRKNQQVEITMDPVSGRPLGLIARGAARSYGPHDPSFKSVEVSRDADLIKVFIFEQVKGKSVPLELQFRYVPSQAFAPIHEIMAGRNERIKTMYRGVWGLAPRAASQAAQEVYTSEPQLLDAQLVSTFCRVVGLNNTAYHEQVSAPLDAAIIIGWAPIMEAAMSVDADLLRLVHLSNSFKRHAGADVLRIGEKYTSSAYVSSIRITPTGKSVSVLGTVSLQDKATGTLHPIVDVESSFFFRGAFTDFGTTFEKSEERYIVEIKSASDAAVLQSKEWFTWTGTTPLKAGLKLELHVKSDVKFGNDASSFQEVEVEGGAYIRDIVDGKLISVGGIEYIAEGKSYGNPVVEYIKRLGGSTLGPVPLEGGGYSLLVGAESSTFVAPATNAPYSAASGDYNPIHTNPYFSDFAGLPGTITHGMHSSAAVRRITEEVAAEGHPERFRSYSANFTGMVLPGDTLEVSLRHIAMHDGRKIVKVSAVNQRGESVLEGEAMMDQPPTVYTFTGQGSQAVGMGMDLYDSSPVAKQIWDRAERHLQTTMGISVLDIVRHNPKSHTCHFGGVAGARIRSQFMGMSFEGPEGISRPLFPEITNTSTSYTFDSPDGLLFMTSFAQISIVLVEVCAFNDMKSRGLIDPEAPFAGHSLGEYGSLAAGGCLSIEDLCDVCLRRGLTMERAVARDEHGRTDYGLMAVAPARIGLTDELFAHIVGEIDGFNGSFVQAINYNVATLQTVVAGNLKGLQTLTHTLNGIAAALK